MKRSFVQDGGSSFYCSSPIYCLFDSWLDYKAPNEGSGEVFTSTNCRDGVFPCFLLKRRYLWRPYETPRKKAFAGQRVSYYNKEWFTYNYLGINSTKTQAMVLGNSSYNFEFFVTAAGY